VSDLPPLVLTLERAVDALASLVKQEYPERYSLVEIAEIWGGNLSPEQVEALRYLENSASAASTKADK
jgi:hypothetical protein